MSDREDIWENGQIVGYRNVVNNVDAKLREPDDPPVNMSKRIISDKKAYEIMAENDKLEVENRDLKKKMDLIRKVAIHGDHGNAIVPSDLIKEKSE